MIHPYFEMGPFTIGVYGACVTLALLTALLVSRMEFERRGHPPDLASGLTVFALVGAFVGSRIAQAIDVHGLGALVAPAKLFLTEGSTFLGGLLGGVICGAAYLRRKRVGFLEGMDAIAPAIVIGYAIGRVGCQLSGDGCYGLATTLPWGMAYPHGAVPTTERVHPTPVYESLAALAVFTFLWTRRKTKARPGELFAWYLLLAGIERFLVEFLRRNPEHAGLTQAQWIGLSMVCAGGALMTRHRWAPRHRWPPRAADSTPNLTAAARSRSRWSC